MSEGNISKCPFGWEKKSVTISKEVLEELLKQQYQINVVFQKSKPMDASEKVLSAIKH